MVVLVVLHDGDLESRAHGHQQMPVQLESSEYHTRRQKCLLVAVILAALPKRGVDLRAQLIENVVLKRRFPGQCMTDGLLIGNVFSK